MARRRRWCGIRRVDRAYFPIQNREKILSSAASAMLSSRTEETSRRLLVVGGRDACGTGAAGRSIFYAAANAVGRGCANCDQAV